MAKLTAISPAIVQTKVLAELLKLAKALPILGKERTSRLPELRLANMIGRRKAHWLLCRTTSCFQIAHNAA